MKLRVQRVVLALSAFLVVAPARAAGPIIFTWSSAPSSGVFDTAGNWTNNAVPNAANHALVFTSSSQSSVVIGTATTIDSLTIDNSGGAFPAYVFSATGSGAINIGLGGMVVQTGGATNVTFDSSLPIVTTANQTWNVGDAVYLNVNGVVSGANVITKSGGGTLVLGGVNTYSGGTIVNGGYLSISADSGLGQVPGSVTPNNLTFDGGALAATETFTINSNRGITVGAGASFLVTTGKTLTYGGNLTGAGNWNLDQFPGTLDLTGANSFTGTVTIYQGTLRASNASALGTAAAGVIINGGASLEINNVAIGAEPVSVGGVGVNTTGALIGTGPSAALSGPITLTADTLIGGTGNLTLSGVIGQTGGTWSLTKSGTGTLNLSGANLYGGSTTIKGGTLQLGASSSLPSSTAVVVAPELAGTTATFDLNGKNQTIAGLALGWASGSTANVSLGAGTLTLGGNLTFDGSSNPVASTITGTGTIDLGAATRIFNIGDSASVSGPEFSIVPALIGTGASVNKTGAGLLEFQGANTYTGGTTISAGGLVARNSSGSATGTGNITINSGALLQIGVGTTTGLVSGAILNNGAITFNRSDAISSTGLSGTGTVAQSGSGTLTLTGTNSYTGNTTINTGAVADGAANVFSPASRIVFNAAATSLNVGFNDAVGGLSGTATNGAVSIASGATLTVGSAANDSFGGVISGAGALAKAGGVGTQTLSGTNTFAGGVSVNTGQLAVGNDGNLGATTGGLTLNSGVLVTTSSFTLDPTRAVSIGASGGGLSQATGTTLTFGGVISGSGTFTKYDNGTLILSGANTYTGATNIVAGTLSAANVNALGTTAGGTTVSSGQTLDINNVVIGAEPVTLSGSGFSGFGALTGTGNASLSGAVTLAGNSNIGGSGTLSLMSAIGESTISKLTKVGPGALILNGTNSYSGGTEIQGGTLSIATDASLGAVPGAATPGSIILNSQARLEAASGFVLSTNRGITLNGSGGQIGVTSDTLVYNGKASGNGSLQKVGAGTLQLSGANDYTGGTQILGGTLQLGDNEALPSDTNVTIKGMETSSATLDLNGKTQTIGTLTFGGSGSMASAMTNVSIGTGGTLNLGGTVFYDATNNPMSSAIDDGTLNLGAVTRTFQVFDSTTTPAELSVSSLIAGAGGLTKTGMGTLSLTHAASTYTGPTWVKEGMLEFVSIADLSTNSSLGAPTTAVDGTIKLGDAGTMGTLRYVGDGAMTTNRAIDLAGTNGGAKILNDGGDVLVFTGGFSASGDATKTLTLAGSMTGKFGGAIVDSATNQTSLLKTGNNTWILTGNSTYTGSTGINYGTLQIGDGGSTGAILGVMDGDGTTNQTPLGTVNLSGESTLAFNRSNAISYAGSIGGYGSLEVDGVGTLTLTGNHSFTDGTYINEGATLSVGAGGVVGSLPFNSYVNNSGTLIFNRSDPSSFNGEIYGEGGLVKKGTNTFSLTNTSSWIGGPVTIEGGTLAMATLSGDGDLVLGNGAASATLRYTGSGDDSERNIVLGTTGGATIEATGSGSLYLYGQVTGSGSGAKTLTLKGDNNESDNELAGGIQNGESGTVGLIKAGFGSWTLSGVNSYTGGTIVNNGTLYLNYNALPANGAVTINAVNAPRAVLALYDTEQLDTIGALTFGGATASPFSNNMLLLMYDSTLALGGDITYDATNGPGPAFIAYDDPFQSSSRGGYLDIGSASRFITVGLSPNAPQDLVITSAFRGDGGTITKAGPGSLLLGGASTYSGGTTVSAGTLLLGSSSYEYETLVNGPVGTGTLTMQSGTRLAGAQAYGNQEGSGDPIRISNPVTLVDNVTFGSPVGDFDLGLELAGAVTATATTPAGTFLHLASSEPIFFSGSLGGNSNALTFDSGGLTERGVAIFGGPIDSTLSNITFDGAAGIFGAPESIASGVQLKVVNQGYLGVGVFSGGEGVAPIPALLGHIATADKTSFDGTFGFDTDPGSYYPYTFDVSGVSFAGFGTNFRIGSMTEAILAGTFTPPANDYTFGGGGGVLVVRSPLTDPVTGTRSVTVNSPTTIDHNALIIVFQPGAADEGTSSNTYTGGLSVTNSIAILDAPTALPALSATIPTAGKFTLGDNGYLGYTEAFTAVSSFPDFLARMSDHTGKSIIGFDSTGYITGEMETDSIFGSAREVSEKIDLSSLSRIGLGTATAVSFTGEILAPNLDGSRTLNLVAPGGLLLVSSPLVQGKVNAVVLGTSDHVLKNGTIALLGQNTYAAGTTLLGGTLLLGNGDKLAFDGSIASGPLGRSAVTVPVTADHPILQPLFSEPVLHNSFTLGSNLQIGTTNLEDIFGDVAGAYGILDEGSGGIGSIVLNGNILKDGTNVGGLDIFTDTTLNGTNTFLGAVNLNYGQLTIGNNLALGDSTALGNALNINPVSFGGDSYVALAVTNGPRTIANKVNINLFSNDTLEIDGHGSLTLTGPVTLNSSVSFEPYNGALFLNGGVGGNGRLSANGYSPVILGGPATYTGGTQVDYGTVIFGGATNTLPNNGFLTVGYSGYIGLSSTNSTVIGSYLGKFDHNNTWGTIGFDTLGTGVNSYDLAIDLNGGSGTPFNSGVSLGSATQAILTGVITPRNDTYQFGNGGGILTVTSQLVDRSNGEGSVARSLYLDSYSNPTTVRLSPTVGTNTFSGGVDVYDAGLIFSATGMPASGSFEVSAGYIGTEKAYGTGNPSLPIADYFNRFESTGSYSVIGFDTATPTAPFVVSEALSMASFGGSTYFGTATAATINSTITLDGASSYRFAGYKGGQLTVNSALPDGSVIIGSRGNIGTAGSPNNPAGPLSTVILTNAGNTYAGGTTLEAGKLLVGSSSALGTGQLYVNGTSTYYSPDTSPLATPVLGVIHSGLNLPNNIYLASDLRVAVGGDNNLDSTATLQLSGMLDAGGSYGSLIKSGPGKLLLSGTNSLDHDIFVEQGNLTFMNAASLGTTPVHLGDLSASVTFDVSMTLNGLSGTSGILNVGASQTLTVDQGSDTEYLGTFAGTGSTLDFSNTHGGTATVRLGGNSTGFSGTANINSNVTVVAGSAGAFGPSGNTVNLAGGTLALENGVTISNHISLAGGGTLAGRGTIQPTTTGLTIGGNVFLAPGFSPGTLTIDGSSVTSGATLVLASAGSYQWQIFDATQALAQWDRIVVTNGTVDIGATSLAPFDFHVQVDPDAGLLGFDVNQSYAWTVLTAPTVNGFAADKFHLMLDETFTGLESHFGLNLVTDGITGNKNLTLNFTAVPEPSTYAMIALGLGAVAFTLRRRRNS